MKNTSESNVEILRFIVESIGQRGFPPSQMEIAKRMGYSGVRATQYHLDQIEDSGWIIRVPGIARGIRVTSSGMAALSI